MNKESMTTKERWLAAIHCKPVDRLPFWPKLGGNYAANQSSPFNTMNNRQIQEWIGSDPHYGIAGCVKEIHKTTSIEHIKDGARTTTIYKTRHGATRLVNEYDPGSASNHPVEFPAKTLEDIRLLTEYFADLDYEFDAEMHAKGKQEYSDYGNGAITTGSIGESPLMYWVEWLAGVEMAHYLLIDHQQEVEALFDVIQHNLVKITEIIAQNSIADLIYLVENTSTTLISPDQYRQYCFKHISEISKIMNQAEKPLVLHMCGHLKALLPDLNKLNTQAFEAFTSPTLGNTTLLDGRMTCPKTCLIGGTNAMLWTKPAGDIIKQLEHDLNELPHHRGIVATSAGVMPPIAKPETIKEVCNWVKRYPLVN